MSQAERATWRRIMRTPVGNVIAVAVVALACLAACAMALTVHDKVAGMSIEGAPDFAIFETDADTRHLGYVGALPEPEGYRDLPDASIDDWVVKNGILYLARAQSTDPTDLHARCEHWEIDLRAHRATRVERSAAGLSCKRLLG